MMELRRELFLTLGALVVLNLLLAFGSVGLFARMGPAIDRILQENVFSLAAAEEILVELALAPEAPLSPRAQGRVSELLNKAEQNVTEKEEPAVLQNIRDQIAPAMNGDLVARRRVVTELRRLIEINHEAMIRVDQEARRLGSAGAWAAVLIGFLSFLLSLLVVLRFQKRLLAPLLELYEVLESAGQGNRLRRCRPNDAPREIEQVTEAVNKLLDERLLSSGGPGSKPSAVQGVV